MLCALQVSPYCSMLVQVAIVLLIEWRWCRCCWQACTQSTCISQQAWWKEGCVGGSLCEWSVVAASSACGVVCVVPWKLDTVLIGVTVPLGWSMDAVMAGQTLLVLLLLLLVGATLPNSLHAG